MTLINRLLIIFGLLILFLPALIYFPNKGTSDMGVWLEWTADVNRWGPLNAYSIINTNHDYETSDYPPISFINLYLALKASLIANVSWMLGIKIILLVYYLATLAVLIYLSTLVRKRSFEMSIAMSSGLFLGGLYFVVNSEAFGYLDITYAPFIVFSLILFARGKYLISGICFGLAILVKWMPVIILPAFLFYFISKKGRHYRIDHSAMFKFFGGIILTVGLLIIGFLAKHLSLLALVGSLKKAFDRPSLSDAGLNFGWIVHYLMQLIYPETYVGVIRNNFYIFQLISAVIFLSVIIAILRSLLKRRKDMASLLQTALMVSWSYFIWRTAVHENHLFITLLLALCLAVLYTNRSNIRQYLWLSFFGLANFVVFFGFPVRESSILIPEGFKVILGLPLSVLLAAFHVLIYLIYLRKFLRPQSRRNVAKISFSHQ